MPHGGRIKLGFRDNLADETSSCAFLGGKSPSAETNSSNARLTAGDARQMGK